MAVNIGPKIGIDGEAEYRKELNNIIQQAKTLDAEMKAVSASFDKNTTSAKKNAAQAAELSKQIKVQEERVKKLGEMVDKSTEKTGANSTTTLKWQQALNEANAELSTMQNRLTEMKVPTQEWAQTLQDTGEKLQKIGNKMAEVGKTLTTHITLPVAAAGAAAVAAASDYEENLNKIDVAFEESASYVKAWADTATESFGLSKNSALEAAALFGDMATSMGFTRNEAAQMSTQLAGLAGDLASFKNISTDQAMNALKSVFTGETESLKNLGVVMTQTNLEAFAEKQGKVYSAASETEKAFMRYQFVLERTQNAQGDYSETSDGFANSLRTLKESLENLAITFGEVLLPVVTPIVQGLGDVVQKISELPEPIKNTIVVIGLIAAAVGPILLTVGKILVLAGQVATILPGLTAGLGAAGAGAGVAAGGVAGLGTALGAALPIIGAVAAAVAVFFGTLAALNFLDEHSEDIKAFFAGIADSAKNGVKKAVTAVEELGAKVDAGVNSMVDKAKEKGLELAANTSETIEGLKEKFPEWIDAAHNFGLDMIQHIADGITETKEKIHDALTGAIDNAIEAAKSALEKVKTWGKELVDGIAEGMEGAQNTLQGAANKTAGTISSYLHFTRPDVGPLADIDRWMPDMMNLLANGIMANMGQIEQAANLTANNIYMPISGNEEIAAGLNRMNNTLSERETPVNVNVTLQGGAEKFFKEVVSVNQRRTMSTGYNQLAMR